MITHSVRDWSRGRSQGPLKAEEGSRDLWNAPFTWARSGPDEESRSRCLCLPSTCSSVVQMNGFTEDDCTALVSVLLSRSFIKPKWQNVCCELWWQFKLIRYVQHKCVRLSFWVCRCVWFSASAPYCSTCRVRRGVCSSLWLPSLFVVVKRIHASWSLSECLCRWKQSVQQRKRPLLLNTQDIITAAPGCLFGFSRLGDVNKSHLHLNVFSDILLARDTKQEQVNPSLLEWSFYR